MSELSEYRLAICATCPYNQDNICILCGCDLAIKTLGPNEKCPQIPPKWNEETSSKPVRVSATPSFASGGPSVPVGTCIPCSQKR